MAVEKNQEYVIEIESFGNSGEGIGHIDGYTLFVTGALPGETVRVVATKVKKNYGYARLLSVEKAAPDRVEPACPVAKRCGGCELQHMSYEAQLRFKAGRVKDCLERLGGVEGLFLPEGFCGSATENPAGPALVKSDGQVPETDACSGQTGGIELQVLGCEEEPWHYRNKAQFPVGLDRAGRSVAGFYAARSHEIIACEECRIQDPIINTVKRIVMDTVRDLKDFKHLYIRRAAATGQTMVCFVVEKETRALDEAIERIKELPEITSICFNLQPDDTNVILGEKYISIFGPLFIEDKIGDITFQIAPESFYQVNSRMTEKLYEKALEYASLTGGETVWDLYCGIGTISLFLAKKAGKVLGVEIVPQAIKNAKENAKINGINNAEFICGAAEDVINEAMANRTGTACCDSSGARSHAPGDPAMVDISSGIPLPDVVVVDPPRKGCDEKLITAIGKANPERIVYVSCDPATLARDVARLREYEYELRKVCAVDQFWQTRHVEAVALMSGV